MSEKKRRDITLGEMQDECKKRETRCGLNSDNPCPYDKTCDAISPNGFSTYGNGRGAVFPCHWNLTDPPRFTEAQMALLKAWRDAGAMAAQLTHDVAGMDSIFFYSFSKPLQIEYCMGFVKNSKVLVGLDFNGEILDLAELLGKDAT